MFGKKRVSKEYLEKTFDLISHLHDKIIEETGGAKGVRDSGGLHHSIHKILVFLEENTNPILVGSFVYEELARRHHFNDGNKRTAHGFAKILIFLLGFHFKIEYKEAVPFIINIAKYQSPVTSQQIQEWINKYLEKVPRKYKKNTTKYLNETIKDINHGFNN